MAGHQISPLAPKIPANPRPAPAKSHRRASVGAPHLPFLSGCQHCVRMFYTLSQVIKEEKRDEEGVGGSKSEKREGWETEIEEEKQERRFRGVFLVFHFLSKGVSRENIITGEGDFPFFQKGERGSREWSLVWKLVFTIEEKGWGVVGLRGLSFLLYTYVSLLTHHIDFTNERCV